MLNIDLEYKRGILFLRLDGILNKDTSSILEDAIKTTVEKAGIKYMLLNFEKLYKIDKYGVYSIINSYNEFLKDKGKLMICGYDNIKINIERSDLIKYATPAINEFSAFELINI